MAGEVWARLPHLPLIPSAPPGMVYQQPDKTLPERRLAGQQAADTSAPHPIVQEDSSEAQGCDPDPASSPQLPCTRKASMDFQRDFRRG